MDRNIFVLIFLLLNTTFLIVALVHYNEIQPPEGFDWETGKVTKQLALTNGKKGGGKKVKRMPRLFRHALLLAIVVVVWDIVIHINDIAMFAVNTFLLHK